MSEPVSLPAVVWRGFDASLPGWARLGRLTNSAAFVALAALAFVVTYALASDNIHVPARIVEGRVITAIVGLMPLVAALTVAYAIFRPWRAFLVVLLLTPCFDAAQVSWTLGSGDLTLQVILQTVFVVALAAGLVRQTREDGRLMIGSSHRRAAAAVAALLVLAVLSTLSSSDRVASLSVLVHGIVEPVAMGAILVALRPTRRDLVWVAVALGISAAIGSLLNMLQVLPTVTSLAAYQAQRVYFAVLTYNNVGIFGQVLAMALPLLVGALLARRRLRLDRWMTALLVAAVLVGLAGLFLTLSKSAWLATSFATILLLLLAAKTWRRRAAIALATGLLSAAVIPWPAYVLQVNPALATDYRTAMVTVMGPSRFDSWNPATMAGRGSMTARLQAAEAGLHMAVDHPLLGVGLDQYSRYYLDGYAVPPVNSRIDHAHSLWPEVAAEIGFPAMLLLGLIYAAALLALWRVYRHPPDEATRLLAAALIASLMAWLVVATAFGSDIYRPMRNEASEMVMMAVVVAAGFALSRVTPPPMPADRPNGPWARIRV
jgi:O-antigen ligase